MSTPCAIGILWIVFLLGMSAHTSVALLPLFAGGEVRDDAMKLASIERDKWMYALLMTVPMLMVGGLLMFGAMPFRWLNFMLSVLLSLANLRHLVEHLKKRPPDHPQNLLLASVLLLSVQLNYFSYLWISEE